MEFGDHLAKLVELVVGKREVRNALEQVGCRLIESLQRDEHGQKVLLVDPNNDGQAGYLGERDDARHRQESRVEREPVRLYRFGLHKNVVGCYVAERKLGKKKGEIAARLFLLPRPVLFQQEELAPPWQINKLGHQSYDDELAHDDPQVREAKGKERRAKRRDDLNDLPDEPERQRLEHIALHLGDLGVELGRVDALARLERDARGVPVEALALEILANLLHRPVLHNKQGHFAEPVERLVPKKHGNQNVEQRVLIDLGCLIRHVACENRCIQVGPHETQTERHGRRAQKQARLDRISPVHIDNEGIGRTKGEGRKCIHGPALVRQNAIKKRQAMHSSSDAPISCG